MSDATTEAWQAFGAWASRAEEAYGNVGEVGLTVWTTYYALGMTPEEAAEAAQTRAASRP